MQSEEYLLEKQSGGRSYFLPGGTEYVPSEANPVMNVDILIDGTGVTTLEAGGVDVIAEMNMTGVSIPATCTDFTHEKPFTKLQFTEDVMLKLRINVGKEN